MNYWNKKERLRDLNKSHINVILISMEFFKKRKIKKIAQNVESTELSLQINTHRFRLLAALYFVLALPLVYIQTCHYIDYDLEQYGDLALFCAFLATLFMAVKLRYKGRLVIIINTLMFLLATYISYCIYQILYNQPFLPLDSPLMFLNYLCSGLPYIICLAITSRARLSIILGGIFTYGISLVNHFLLTFRGEPFFFNEFFAVGTALDVGKNYHYEVNGDMLIAAVCFILLMAIGFMVDDNKIKGKISYRPRIIAMVLLGGFLLYFNLGTPEEYYQSWYRSSNGYAYTFCINMKMLHEKVPGGYKAQNLSGYIPKEPELLSTPSLPKEGSENLGTPFSEKPKKPNIVVVMNESFADLKCVAPYKANVDYMPFYNSLKENAIKGRTSVSVFGGGTCDSEYTFLTGNTTGFLSANARPYQLYMHEPAPSLAWTLNQQGYTSHAIHPGSRGAWNRDNAYGNLGFKDFTAEEAFVGAEHARGMYISDGSDYAMIKTMFENRKSEEPLFLFDVTIQNHGPYYGDTNTENPIRLEGMEGKYPDVEEYLSLIRRSDEELRSLVEYFKMREEPVILLYFGDHLPSVDDKFFEEIMGKETSDWSIEEVQKKYETPYLIWANYDIKEETTGVIGLQYLSSILINEAGLQMTPYQKFLLELSKKYPIINSSGFMNSKGKYFYDIKQLKDDKDIKAYREFLYNCIFDSKNRQNQLYYLDDTKIPKKMALPLPSSGLVMDPDLVTPYWVQEVY